jgi:hypothetical protein
VSRPQSSEIHRGLSSYTLTCPLIFICVLFYCFLIYFLFYSAISGSFYALSKLKGSPFNRVYSRITIISCEAYTLLFNLKLYSSLFKFRSFIFIILGSIATSLLCVPRFTLGLVSQLELSNILKPRSLSILY